jgi:hypothetical protein
VILFFFFYLALQPFMSLSLLNFEVCDHTQGRTTVGRTPLDERSARHRDLYLTTHKTHNRQTSMPSAEFKPATSATDLPQAKALDRSASGVGGDFLNFRKFTRCQYCLKVSCDRILLTQN